MVKSIWKLEDAGENSLSMKTSTPKYRPSRGIKIPEQAPGVTFGQGASLGQGERNAVLLAWQGTRENSSEQVRIFLDEYTLPCAHGPSRAASSMLP